MSVRPLAPLRVLVLGGAPFEEEVVMWWNFIGRTHEDVEAAREAWQAGAGGDPGRFGRVEGYEGPVARIPAPALPRVRLRARGNRGSAPAGGARGSGTNDKAGSKLNLTRWVSARNIKETFSSPLDWRYPFLG